MRVTTWPTLLLLLLLASQAGAAPPREEARARAEFVIRTCERIYEQSERLALDPLLDHLADPDWLVRRYTIIRLRASGLSDEHIRTISPNGRPDSDPVESWVIADIRAELRANAGLPSLEPVQLSSWELPVGMVGMSRELLRRELPGNEALRLVDLCAGILEGLGEDDALLVLPLFLTLIDKPAAEAACDLGDRLREDDVEAVLDWYWQQRPYFFHWWRAGRLWLDEDAREAGTPSADYRSSHPWPTGAGPERPESELRSPEEQR